MVAQERELHKRTAKLSTPNIELMSVLTFRHFGASLDQEKECSRGRVLEHLEFCGTKIKMRGPIVRQLCERRNRNKILENISRFFTL